MTSSLIAPRTRAFPRWARFAAALAVGAFLVGPLAGCASSDIVLEIVSKKETNDGRPFHVVIRSVPSSDFASETYESVANLPYARPVDDTVILADYIFPGVDKEIVVPKPDRYPLAVYFLFTKPGPRWKMALKFPIADSIEVVLGDAQVAEIIE